MNTTTSPAAGSPDVTTSPRPGPELMRLARLLLGPHGNADHLVSRVQACAEAESGRHNFAGPVSRQAWTLRLIVQACRESLAGLAPSRVWEHAHDAEHLWQDPGHGVDLEALTAALQRPSALDDALADLPDVDRIAVVLRDAVRLSDADCVTITRAPREILERRLLRGRLSLLRTLTCADTSTAAGCDDLPAECATARLSAENVAEPANDDGRGPANENADAGHLASCAACTSLMAGFAVLSKALAAHEPAPKA